MQFLDRSSFSLQQVINLAGSAHLPHQCAFQLNCAGWTYWELRNEWKTRGSQKQDWKELPTPLFDVDTVEDFWICYSRCPKIV